MYYYTKYCALEVCLYFELFHLVDVFQIISPLPVFTPEGTIGLPSVRQSVSRSVSLSVRQSVSLSAKNLDPLIT